MQVTEKTRNQILFALPELSDNEAERIATIEGCSKQTVYRHYKRLKLGDRTATSIVLALGSLAVSKMPKAKKTHKQLLKIEKQLSAA